MLKIHENQLKTKNAKITISKSNKSLNFNKQSNKNKELPKYKFIKNNKKPLNNKIDINLLQYPKESKIEEEKNIVNLIQDTIITQQPLKNLLIENNKIKNNKEKFTLNKNKTTNKLSPNLLKFPTDSGKPNNKIQVNFTMNNDLKFYNKNISLISLDEKKNILENNFDKDKIQEIFAKNEKPSLELINDKTITNIVDNVHSPDYSKRGNRDVIIPKLTQKNNKVFNQQFNDNTFDWIFDEKKSDFLNEKDIFLNINNNNNIINIGKDDKDVDKSKININFNFLDNYYNFIEAFINFLIKLIKNDKEKIFDEELNNLLIENENNNNDDKIIKIKSQIAELNRIIDLIEKKININDEVKNNLILLSNKLSEILPLVFDTHNFQNESQITSILTLISSISFDNNQLESSLLQEIKEIQLNSNKLINLLNKDNNNQNNLNINDLKNIDNIEEIKELYNELNSFKDEEKNYEFVIPSKYSIENLKCIKKGIIKGVFVKVYENKVIDIINKYKTTKRIFPDGFQISFYFNNDKKLKYPDKSEFYYYSVNQTTEFRFPSKKINVYKFKNGQFEKHYSTYELNIKFADGSYKIVRKGKELLQYPNGKLVFKDKMGRISEINNNIIN